MVNGALATALKIGVSGATGSIIKDEDNMVSDSATHLATQQSIKAYVDAQVGSNNEWSEVLANGNTSGANDVIIDNGQGLVVGHTAQIATGGVTSETQILGTGANDSSLLLGAWSTTDSTAASLTFAKSANATIGSYTTVADNETLGTIFWRASDSTDIASQAASISAQIDGTPGNNDVPGRLIFSTASDGAASATEAFRIDSNQNTLIADGNGLVVGHTAQVATNFTSEFQVIGTGNNDSSMSIQRYSADATGAFLWLSKSRGALGTPGTAVVDNDVIGEIRFTGDDGGDLATSAVAIRAEVDDSAIAANEVGGALVLSTAPGASANDLTEALRIDSSQRSTFSAALKLSGNEASVLTDANYIRYASASGDTHLDSQGGLFVNIDSNNNGTSAVFGVRSNASSTDLFAVGEGGTAYIGDTANANMTAGLTINQGANDDQILAFKSSDVAHGMTSAGAFNMETDSFYSIQKGSSTSGGVQVMAVADNSGGTVAYAFDGYGGSNVDTTKSTSGRAGIEFFFSQHDNSNALSNVVADGNVLAIRARSGGSSVTRYLFDVEGSAHADVEWTTFSDGRLKKNQRELPYGLAEVLQLQPKMYERDSGSFDEGKLVLEGRAVTQAGFVAQEVESVMPEFVKTPSNDESFYSMDTGRLVTVAIKAIQELNDKVEALTEGK
jgi:hypothetical protein